MEKNLLIKKMVLNSLFIALCLIATTIISIPFGNHGGYINLGDSIIIISSIYLGPISGCIVGSVGSTIADLILAPHYAIFTFFIKGLEGLIVGLIFKKIKNKYISFFVASTISLLIMVIGYYITSLIMYFFDFYLALLDVPFI